MRDIAFLTPQSPRITKTLPWQVASIMVSNPTGSAVLFRQGGNDVPSRDGATLIIPAQCVFQFPAIGTNFAFGFDNVALVGTAAVPPKTCSVMLLDRHELLSAIGSISYIGLARLAPEDRNSVHYVTNSYSTVSPGSYTLWTFQTQIGRRSRINRIHASLTRSASATSGGFASLKIQKTNFQSQVGNICTCDLIDNTIGRVVQDNSDAPLDQVAGESLSAIYSDNSTGGSVIVAATADITDYDV